MLTHTESIVKDSSRHGLPIGQTKIFRCIEYVGNQRFFAGEQPEPLASTGTNNLMNEIKRTKSATVYDNNYIKIQKERSLLDSMDDLLYVKEGFKIIEEKTKVKEYVIEKIITSNNNDGETFDQKCDTGHIMLIAIDNIYNYVKE